MLKTTFVAVAALCATAAAHAATHNGVANADLTQLVGGGTFTGSIGLAFASNSNPDAETLAGWTNDGYNFVFTPGSGDDTSSTQTGGQYAPSNAYLYGPGDGTANGFTSESPTGGNYFGLDGAYETGAVGTTITGMKAGDTYTLSFAYAGIQQYGYNGPTTETVQVTIGGTTYDEPVLDDVSNGFTGWQQETINFVATSASETLSFLAIGTPNGVPPFTLLSDISVPVPEPAAWTLMIAGLGGLGLALRNRRRTAMA
jgi:hypothetical protein